ncbi:MAG: outer membrane protein transport protein [Hyphomicrobium sp.]|nr:outer membrane protein transport protein [Hyphomicrobium sp.]
MVEFRQQIAGLLAFSSAVALGAAAPAEAGGFDVREQSALFQGMSFAGAAAGGTSLASMFWNPAAAGYVGNGITMDSSYSLILPRADLTVDTIDFGGGPIPAGLTGLDTTVDVGADAIVPASYAAYRFSDSIVLAMSMNSQFGLGTEPDNRNWVGQNVGRTAKLFSVNAAPTIAYEIMDGIQIGAGVQVQYIDLKRLRFAAGRPSPDTPSGTLSGDDIGVGYTLGVNFRPLPGTSIGVGFRSKIDHELEGTAKAPGSRNAITAELETPEKVTLGIRQDLMPGFRVHGTVEWTNWDRLTEVPVILAAAPVEVARLQFNWDDGWYFALGGEYDYSELITLRAGVGYEISPIQDATSRLVQLPDADRVWLSVGGSYKVGDLFGLINDAEIDFAYSHLFVEESDFERGPASTAFGGFPVIAGDVEASVDIISVGLRSKF